MIHTIRRYDTNRNIKLIGHRNKQKGMSRKKFVARSLFLGKIKKTPRERVSVLYGNCNKGSPVQYALSD